MKHRRSLHVPVVLIGVALGSLAAPAAAAPPVQLEGTYQIVGGTERVDRQSGNVLHSEFTLFTMLSGDLVSAPGTPVATTYDCVEVVGRSVTCRTEETFTGTIAGIGSGTTEARGRSRCDLTTGACSGSSSVRGVSGALADVRGTARFEGPILAPGTYTARVNRY